MRVKKYVKDNVVVEAVQWKGNNLKDIFLLTGYTHAEIVGGKVYMDVNNSMYRTEVIYNDYIIKNLDSNEIKVLPPSIFESSFKNMRGHQLEVGQLWYNGLGSLVCITDIYNYESDQYTPFYLHHNRLYPYIVQVKTIINLHPIEITRYRVKLNGKAAPFFRWTKKLNLIEKSPLTIEQTLESEFRLDKLLHISCMCILNRNADISEMLRESKKGLLILKDVADYILNPKLFYKED